MAHQLTVSPEDRLLTQDEAAAALRLTTRELYGLGIPHLKLSRRTRRYREADIRAFIVSRIGRAA